MPCINRLTKSSLRLPFPDGKHYFYGESACGSGCDGDLCDSCIKKTSEHGLVTGPYIDKSHIYDTVWYHKAVRTYGQPSMDIVAVAMEAQKKARGGKRVSTLTPVSSSGSMSIEELTRKASSINLNEQSSPTVTEKKPEKKPEKKRGRPKKISIQEIKPDMNQVVSTHTDDMMVETMDEPLEVQEVMKVILRPFKHGSTLYWHDEQRDKLYKYISETKKGKYVGRWDMEKVQLGVPDSDEESFLST